MPTISEKQLHKTFVRQQDQSDCGVAALLSVIRYFGGAADLERLRELSGTTRQGTTLLGLYQAARQCGLRAQALQAESAENLITAPFPCILHIITAQQLQHYVVCYGYTQGMFSIADPAIGIRYISAAELEQVWVSKTLLTLCPDEGFVTVAARNQEKRRWMWELIEQDLTVLFVSFVLGIVLSVLSLSTAIFSQQLVDSILPKHNTEKLVTGLVLLGILLTARIALQFLRSTFVVTQSRHFNERVIHRFFDRLMYLPQSFFDRRKTGDLIARMNDAQRLQSALNYLVGELMIDAIVFMTTVVMVFVYSLPIGLFLLGSTTLYGFLAYRFHKPVVEGQQSVMVMHGVNESHYVDTIQGMSAIKAAGKEEAFLHKTRTIYGRFQEQVYHLGKTGIRFNRGAESIVTVILFVVLIWSSLLVLQGILLVGALVAIVQMAAQVNSSSLRLALLNIRLQEARIAFERMYTFASIAPEFYPDSPKTATPELLNAPFSLTLRKLQFRFAGRRELFRNVFFHVSAGEMIGLTGENGSGKTTLLQIIQRLYNPEQGEILINETIPLQEIPIPQWRRHVGVMPQQIKIFNASVLENICLSEPTEEEIQKVMALCTQYNFDPIINSLPQGLATLVGEEGLNLSGGQRQIIGLARALYNNPKLLLLDEPTASMDSKTEHSVLELLHRIKTHTTIIMITHRLQPLGYCDRVYEMQNGHLQQRSTAQMQVDS